MESEISDQEESSFSEGVEQKYKEMLNESGHSEAKNSHASAAANARPS